MNQYQNLKVWQKGKELAVAVYKATAGFPAHENFGLTTQLRRSAVSVASNIAEGAGRNTKGEFIQFLGIATGSIYELETQLMIATELGYMKEEHFRDIQPLVHEVSKMLYSFRQHLSSTKDSRLRTKD